ncbi:MAG: KOW domain-containing RNA-binding protein [Clostridia bacterium]|nr:KOW domain-containing RNA-binding protein [Clostridia bacterium]
MLEVGDIVESKSGHDAKKFFVVVATLNEKYVLIADGRTRKLDSPKQKNVRHIRLVKKAEGTQTYVDDKSIADELAKLDIV